MRRIVAEIEGIVDARELYFRTPRHRLDRDVPPSVAPHGRADDGYGDIFLVVDGWSTVRAEFDELEPRLQALAGRGLTFGRPPRRDREPLDGLPHPGQGRSSAPGSSCRLGDPMDSEIDRKVAVNVPKDRPGRGLSIRSTTC